MVSAAAITKLQMIADEEQVVDYVVRWNKSFFIFKPLNN